jgi:hypothetical protein
VLKGHTVIRHQMITPSGRKSNIQVSNTRHKVNVYRRMLIETGVQYLEYETTAREAGLNYYRDSSMQYVKPDEYVTVFDFIN